MAGHVSPLVKEGHGVGGREAAAAGDHLLPQRGWQLPPSPSHGRTDPWTQQRLVLSQAVLLFQCDFFAAGRLPAEPHDAFLICLALIWAALI